MTQPPPMPAAAERSRPPGPRLLTSFILMGVGIVVGIVAVVAIIIPLAGSFTSSTYIVPGELRLHLHDAEYTVYQFTGTQSVFGGSDSIGATRIPPSQLAVTAPDGSQVPVSFANDNEQLTRGRNVYTGSLVFDVPAEGDYLLQFTNPTQTRVIVSRSIVEAVKGVWAWFVVGGLGGLLFVAGVVMLIVGSVRRGRVKRAAYAAAYGPPPQWGPPQQAQWGTPPVQQWAPPQQQWGPPPQQQWGPPPQQQWAPPPAQPTTPPPPSQPPSAPPSEPPTEPPQWNPPAG